jgi:N-acetylglucosamine-6-phosphate deacetylase
MNLTGKDARTGEKIIVELQGAVVQNVDPYLGRDSLDDVYLSAGFIDLQVNGFAGVDFNSPSASREAIAGAIRTMFSTGVTRFFPTVITGAPDTMLGALRNLADAREALEFGSAMEAFHVEGPHISPEDGPRGAHPKEWVRPPDIEEFRRMQDAAQGHIRLVTIAPDWPETPRFIEQLSRQGVVAGIGHTQATPQQIRDAVSAGARMSTHLGNGGTSSLPRRDNYLFAQLAEDRLAASFIVDGHHLSESFLKIALRAKGIERSVLVTDAVAPAMSAPGPYTIGGVAVQLHEDGHVTLRGDDVDTGRLAGSALRMDQAISNVMRSADLSLAQAIIMATSNAARVGRIPGRLRGIQPGERADLVKFRLTGQRVEIMETWAGGTQVF